MFEAMVEKKKKKTVEMIYSGGTHFFFFVSTARSNKSKFWVETWKFFTVHGARAMPEQSNNKKNVSHWVICVEKESRFDFIFIIIFFLFFAVTFFVVVKQQKMLSRWTLTALAVGIMPKVVANLGSISLAILN